MSILTIFSHLGPQTGIFWNSVQILVDTWTPRRKIDGRKLAKLAKLGDKYDLSYRLSVDSNGECVLNREIVPHGRVIQSIIDAWRMVATNKFRKQLATI